MAQSNNRIFIVGGSNRGKTTLAKQLAAQHKLTHLCTDPQKLLPSTMNGTPDYLDYSGEHGVGQWVVDFWFFRDRVVVEGAKLIDALRRGMSDGARESSHFCDRLIVLTERVGNNPTLPGQERQATHAAKVLEELDPYIDNAELWYPVGSQFRRGSY